METGHRFGERVGFTLQRVTLIEGGQLNASDLSDTRIERLASVFECSRDWLIHGYESFAEEPSPWALADRASGIYATFTTSHPTCEVEDLDLGTLRGNMWSRTHDSVTI